MSDEQASYCEPIERSIADVWQLYNEAKRHGLNVLQTKPIGFTMSDSDSMPTMPAYKRAHLIKITYESNEGHKGHRSSSLNVDASNTLHPRESLSPSEKLALLVEVRRALDESIRGAKQVAVAEREAIDKQLTDHD